MHKKSMLMIGLAALGVVVSSSVSAHMGVTKENSFSLGENTREYLEGSSATLGLKIPHDCSGNAVTDATVVFPNGEGLSTADFYTKDHSGNFHGANALMNIKAKVNFNWDNVAVVKGSISPYYNHGVKSEDTRAVHWTGGFVDNDHYENLEISANFPSIHADSCVKSLKIELPAVQYCANGHSVAWIGSFDTNFQVSETSRVEEFFEPSLRVVRRADNPLPESCGEGEEVVVKPSVSDMNTYLPLAASTEEASSSAVASQSSGGGGGGAIALYGLLALMLAGTARRFTKFKRA